MMRGGSWYGSARHIGADVDKSSDGQATDGIILAKGEG
jgi:hypothetical protein